ncbi:hypothetical protein PCAR4_1210026 [Paraburkholderia caribensis]|nr:hypothetical protein PCAR4_1210026 [Paraburkholderia caribensis]
MFCRKSQIIAKNLSGSNVMTCDTRMNYVCAGQASDEATCLKSLYEPARSWRRQTNPGGNLRDRKRWLVWSEETEDLESAL